MKRVVLAGLILASLIAGPAWAGRIFGDITMGGKPLPEGVELRITQPLGARDSTAAGADTTRTDKFGSYKLNVKTEGKCILTVLMARQTAQLAVFSYKVATRYDLIVEQLDGKLTVRRK